MTQPDKYFKYLINPPLFPKPGDLIRSTQAFAFVNLVIRVNSIKDDHEHKWVHSIRYAETGRPGYLFGTRVRPFKWIAAGRSTTYGNRTYYRSCPWRIVVEYRPVDSQDIIQKHLEYLKGKDLYYSPNEPLDI